MSYLGYSQYVFGLVDPQTKCFSLPFFIHCCLGSSSSSPYNIDDLSRFFFIKKHC